MGAHRSVPAPYREQSIVDDVSGNFHAFFAASLFFGATLLVITMPIGDKVLSGIFIGALMVVSGLAIFVSTQPLDPRDIDAVSKAINRSLNDRPSNQPA